MAKIKLLFATALMMGLSTFVFAGAKDGATASDSKADAKATAKVDAADAPAQAGIKADEDDELAVYLYNGGPGDDVNDPTKYGTTPIVPSQACQGTSKRCAATFHLVNGQRVGQPIAPTYNKD